MLKQIPKTKEFHAAIKGWFLEFGLHHNFDFFSLSCGKALTTRKLVRLTEK